jgi:DNA-binding LacI/PurR family transcriptional regulator
MEEGGIPICEGLIVEGDFTADTAYERALELLNQDDPPTAIFASNDQAAFGVFRAAEEKGINIPGDLSLVGFDNIPAATLRDLTTVDQSVDEMGYTGAQMLFELIQGIQPEEMSPVVPTELIIRGSTISI